MSKFAPIAPLFRCDAYKLAHAQQYKLAGDVTQIYCNYTNRKSRIPGIDHVVHFGLQGYIKQHLMDGFEPFFNSKRGAIALGRLYRERVTQVLGEAAADAIGTEHIERLHNVGYLPVRFRAVPEGTLVPIGVPSFTVENTLPEFYWLPNFLETGLSCGVWQASTSATIAHQFRLMLNHAAKKTSAKTADVNYQCHDFSMRGMSSLETAAVSGAAHLLSFDGSDSLGAMDWIDNYYGGWYNLQSVPATEHSVMCAGIATVGELEMISRLLDLYPTGTVAIVGDTFDLWRVLTDYLPKLRDKILNRPGKLVIRPDSGDPEKILLGDDSYRPQEPAFSGVVQLLGDTFGIRHNNAGYLKLDPHVGVIYGDGITLERAESITAHLIRQGWVSTTVTFGVGSYTYQHQTRDTFGTAMKATWALVDGVGVNLRKDPVTDDGTKRSATGRLAVLVDDTTGELRLLEAVTPGSMTENVFNLLQPVWEDGVFHTWQTFDEVRAVLNK